MEDRSARLRIGQLASRTGVEPERLRKWESRYGLLDPQRSPGGFRLYSQEDERRVRLMTRHLSRGYAAAEAAELARQGIVAPSPARLRPGLPAGVVSRSQRMLARALTEYDESAAQRALDDLFQAFTVEAVLRDALLPFMRGIGDGWERGRVTPGQEHFASMIVEARLMAMTRGWGSGTGPRALLACPSGERHTLGLLAFGIALARQGWKITYLGADTPVESVASAAAALAPALVMLAACDESRFVESADGIRAIREHHNVRLAGAGATAARDLGLEAVMTDPVTAAATLTDGKKNRPA